MSSITVYIVSVKETDNSSVNDTIVCISDQMKLESIDSSEVVVIRELDNEPVEDFHRKLSVHIPKARIVNMLMHDLDSVSNKVEVFSLAGEHRMLIVLTSLAKANKLNKLINNEMHKVFEGTSYVVSR